MITRRTALSGLLAATAFGSGQASAITLPSKRAAGSAVRGVTQPYATIQLGKKVYTADENGNFIFPTPIIGPGTLELVVTPRGGQASKTSFAFAGRKYETSIVKGLSRLAADNDLPDDPERVVKSGPPLQGSGQDALTVMRKKREAELKEAAWKEKPNISAFASKFVRPLQVWRVTSEWGSIREKHYLDGRVVETQHLGLDLGRPDATKQVGGTIIAPADGKVVLVGNDFFYQGNCVFLAHGGGLVTAYYHMASPSQLKLGQMVRQGDLIGQQGTTGSSTAIHLCWRAQIGDQAIDPRSLLD